MRLLLLLSLLSLIQVFGASITETTKEKIIDLVEYNNENYEGIIEVSSDVSDGSDGEEEVVVRNQSLDRRKSSDSRSIPSSCSPNIEVTDFTEAKDEGGSVQVEHEAEDWLFPHKVGIRNHANNCYASSLIACLYNIPVVQKALFDQFSSLNLRKEDSIPVALATIFYKMRFGKSFIDLEPFFIPAVKKTFDWRFGGIECVLEFWNQLSTALPESLFQFELQENRFRKSDNVLIKSVAQKSNLILVSPSKKYRDIEEFLANDFVDEEAEDFIIEAEEAEDYSHLGLGIVEEKISIPSRTSLTILNCPEVLIFGVKRVRWNSETNSSEFDSTPLGFPEKLTINSEEYTIVGNVEYDENRIHYYSQNYDLLDDQWYIHDDKQVIRIPDTEEDFMGLTKRFIHNSSMVFYVKSSSLEMFKNKETVELSEELVVKLKSRRGSSQQPPASGNILKRKRNVDSTVVDTIAVAVEDKVTSDTVIVSDKVTSDTTVDKESKVVKKVRTSYKKRPKAVVTESQEFEPVPIKILTAVAKNPKAKRVYKPRPVANENDLKYFDSSFGMILDFRLGSKQFLFAKEDRHVVLEPILMAFAFHPKLVTKLFEVAETKTPEDFEFKFALVVLRILSGHMGVETKELADILVERYSIDFKDIGSSWRKISEIISPEISSTPDLKIVTYKEDEPMSIETIQRCDSFVLEPSRNLRIPRNLSFSGPAYDTVVDANERIFYRTILNSNPNDIIVPIPVKRIFEDPASGTYIYDSNPVEINTVSYIIHGFIGIDKQGKGTFAIFSDYLKQKRFLFYNAGIPMYKESTTPVLELIVSLMKKESSLFLLTKADEFYAELPMLSNVPKKLFDEMNRE